MSTSRWRLASDSPFVTYHPDAQQIQVDGDDEGGDADFRGVLQDRQQRGGAGAGQRQQPRHATDPLRHRGALPHRVSRQRRPAHRPRPDHLSQHSRHRGQSIRGGDGARRPQSRLRGGRRPDVVHQLRRARRAGERLRRQRQRLPERHQLLRGRLLRGWLPLLCRFDAGHIRLRSLRQPLLGLRRDHPRGAALLCADGRDRHPETWRAVSRSSTAIGERPPTSAA